MQIILTEDEYNELKRENDRLARENCELLLNNCKGVSVKLEQAKSPKRGGFNF